jgi:hypothetical protein
MQAAFVLAVVLIFFALGYLTREHVSAMLPVFLGALRGFAWWRQTPSGDEIDALPAVARSAAGARATANAQRSFACRCGRKSA